MKSPVPPTTAATTASLSPENDENRLTNVPPPPAMSVPQGVQGYTSVPPLPSAPVYVDENLYRLTEELKRLGEGLSKFNNGPPPSSSSNMVRDRVLADVSMSIDEGFGGYTSVPSSSSGKSTNTLPADYHPILHQHTNSGTHSGTSSGKRVVFSDEPSYLNTSTITPASAAVSTSTLSDFHREVLDELPSHDMSLSTLGFAPGVWETRYSGTGGGSNSGRYR